MKPALLVITVLVLAALTGAAEEPVDILSVTPESLSGADAATLAKEANTAYQDGPVRGRRPRLHRGSFGRPGERPGSLYNLACCYGLLGHAEQAARFLEAAFKAGFTRPRARPAGPRLRQGPLVRGVPRLRRAGWRRRRPSSRSPPPQARSPSSAPVVADVRVFAADGERAGRPPPAPRGPARPRQHRRVVRGLFAPPRRRHPVPLLRRAGPLRVPRRPAPSASSWSFEGPGAATRCGATRRTLRGPCSRAVEAVKAAYPVDERNVFLLGFSQGAGSRSRRPAAPGASSAA